MVKERIDKILLDRGFADTHSVARALVMSGVILVDEKRVEKPSELYPASSVIRVKKRRSSTKYASRGGEKLEKALEHFHIRPTGYVCLDIGSSTGGFSDCLLKHGAAKVVAVDSGSNQLIWELRNDSRMDVRENTNARGLLPEHFDQLFDIVVIDVSFISVKKLLPLLSKLVKDNGSIICLIKPQFEVRRGEVGEGGIVRDPEKHKRVVEEINTFAEGLGLIHAGTIESPILGAKGNKEFLALYAKKGKTEFTPNSENLNRGGFNFENAYG